MGEIFILKKRILFVCLGNICRSPAAEAVFLKQVKDLGIEDLYDVDSAGTGGWHVGHMADARMRKAALERGIEINSRAREIDQTDFDNFDLILTMDNDNLSVVKDLLLKSKKKSNVIIKPLLSFHQNNKFSEVPDPYYGGENGFKEVLDLLEEAINNLIKSY